MNKPSHYVPNKVRGRLEERSVIFYSILWKVEKIRKLEESKSSSNGNIYVYIYTGMCMYIKLPYLDYSSLWY